MRLLAVSAVLGVCLCPGLGLAGSNHGEAGDQRIICVVPMIGTGTLTDPKRPMFVASRDTAESKVQVPGFAEPIAIRGFHSQPSDDGLFAIVEFVANGRKALAPILAAQSDTVKVYDRQRVSSANLAKELRKVKKDFSLADFEEGQR